VKPQNWVVTLRFVPGLKAILLQVDKVVCPELIQVSVCALYCNVPCALFSFQIERNRLKAKENR